MIATISGTVTERLGQSLIVEVSGVGYDIRVITDDLTSTKIGETTKLYIHEHIREDAHDLYGFTNLEAKELFEKLLSVSGVGPKVALSILSASAPQQIYTAIAGGNSELFQAVSGVGRKVAARIVIELKHKLSGNLATDLAGETDDPSFEALKQLGFSPSQAVQALASLPANITGDEQRLKQALKKLGSRS